MTSKIKVAEEKQTQNSRVKKIKPLSKEKQITKILKKIENKENEITFLTNQLQDKINNNKTKIYEDILNKLNETQNELEVLEKEWIEMEEKSLDD